MVKLITGFLCLLAYTFRLIEAGHVTLIHHVKTFSAGSNQDAFAFMRREQHMDSNASYLIGGGLRGFCRSLAITHAKHGVKKLAVMSRSGSKEGRSQDAIANCGSLGCITEEYIGDVTSSTDIRLVLVSTKPTIRGIIQASMVLRVCYQKDKLTRLVLLALKNNYHDPLLGQPPEFGLTFDFFTMISHVSGITGQRGQTNYAAANAFMDSFAQHRQALGLAANSITLGAVSDVGYIAQQGGMEQHFDWDRWAKDRYFNDNPETVPQLPIGLQIPELAHPDLQRDSRFPLLISKDSDASQTNKSNVGLEGPKQFLANNPDVRLSALVPHTLTILNKKLRKIMRLNDLLDPLKALSAFGLNSLSAVERRNWMPLELGPERHYLGNHKRRLLVRVM
ncbi:hypothetical protein BBP40_007609 [Aspergillus hancockii]|nr:hypothetical protein BBP40_007609 [Aspergillus hancockii]